MNNKFGKDIVTQLVSVKIEYLCKKPVCVVRMKKMPKIGEFAYIDDHVYVRTGPRVDQLTTEQVVKLIARQKESQFDRKYES